MIHPLLHGKVKPDYNLLMTDRLDVHRLGSEPDWDLNGPPRESSDTPPGLQRLDHLLGKRMLRLQTDSREENEIEDNFIRGEN